MLDFRVRVRHRAERQRFGRLPERRVDILLRAAYPFARSIYWRERRAAHTIRSVWPQFRFERLAYLPEACVLVRRPSAMLRDNLGVAGVQVFAPDYLRALYPDDETVVLDVVDEMAESLSIETEYGCRLVLRGEHTDSEGSPEVCDVEPARPTASREVVGELPEALRGLRIR